MTFLSPDRIRGGSTQQCASDVGADGIYNRLSAYLRQHEKKGGFVPSRVGGVVYYIPIRYRCQETLAVAVSVFERT